MTPLPHLVSAPGEHDPLDPLDAGPPGAHCDVTHRDWSRRIFLSTTIVSILAQSLLPHDCPDASKAPTRRTERLPSVASHSQATSALSKRTSESRRSLDCTMTTSATQATRAPPHLFLWATLLSCAAGHTRSTTCSCCTRRRSCFCGAHFALREWEVNRVFFVTHLRSRDVHIFMCHGWVSLTWWSIAPAVRIARDQCLGADGERARDMFWLVIEASSAAIKVRYDNNNPCSSAHCVRRPASCSPRLFLMLNISLLHGTHNDTLTLSASRYHPHNMQLIPISSENFVA
ncbi:hypothetical protein GGX14DRAFT_609644 [Mycena pura]|uniref:Uncharacterized protein n=1 Tax=Mycena pura TaxID=153505 RepID=A0AAD6VJL7_9AGAR|nr:hypothetical protein GGX14DRAFT_609644 [Mycena pura]